MLELDNLDQLSSYTGKEFSIKDIENSTMVFAEKLWIYYVHAGSLFRSGFAYKKKGSKILCRELIGSYEIESIPEYKKASDNLVSVSEDTKKKVCLVLDALVCTIQENGIEPFSFSDSENKESNNMISRTKSGLWAVKRKDMARTVFRSELASVVFACGMGVELADRIDAIPEDVQKNVYREYGQREWLIDLKVSWIDHKAVQVQKWSQERQNAQNSINTQNEEIAQENDLPGYFR